MNLLLPILEMGSLGCLCFPNSFLHPLCKSLRTQMKISFNHLQRSCFSPLTHNISSPVIITLCNIIATQLNLLTLEHGYKTVFISPLDFGREVHRREDLLIRNRSMCQERTQMKNLSSAFEVRENTLVSTSTNTHSHSVFTLTARKTSFKVNHPNLYLANWIMGK